jgi:hypothetical protein
MKKRGEEDAVLMKFCLGRPENANIRQVKMLYNGAPGY